jgi:hypothetical protein
LINLVTARKDGQLLILNIMITSAFNKSEIAYQYYRHKYPNRDYDKEQARKQFQQDKNKDYKLLIKVVKIVCREQTSILVALAKD